MDPSSASVLSPSPADHAAAVAAQKLLAVSVDSVSRTEDPVTKEEQQLDSFGRVQPQVAAALASVGAPENQPVSDFESASSDMLAAPGVGTANTGEGASFGVENTISGLHVASSGQNSSNPASPSLLGTLTSSLPSMNFRRPSGG